VTVAVIGGGIAGLSAAFELMRQAVPFVVLEAAARPGGVILSEEVDGFTVDAGPDSLLVQKPDGIRLCEELGLGSRLIPTSPPRVSFIQRGGRLHPLAASSVLGIPTEVGPMLRTRLFSWAGKARMAAEVMIPAKADTLDESIGGFVTRRFGAEATRYLAEPLLAGIHAGDVNRLSIASLFPRFVEAERQHGSLIRAFRRERRPAGSGEGAFRSLPGGLSELVAALEAALPPGAIRLNRTVTALLPSTDGVTIHLDSAPPLGVAAAVVATPAFVASRLLDDADHTLAALCAEVPYTSTATIALAFDRSAVSHPLDGSGFVVPEIESTGILAASWLSSKWAHRAPAGKVLMRAFAGGARDPDAVDRSDEELVRTAQRALGGLLELGGDPLWTRVYRWRRANAQHEIGHAARMGRIEAMLARHPRLFLTGSGFRGVGIPDCIADGRATARKVAECVRSLPAPARS
jgi:oxygen-dependent protoporphyrinogen oxidase